MWRRNPDIILGVDDGWILSLTSNTYNYEDNSEGNYDNIHLDFTTTTDGIVKRGAREFNLNYNGLYTPNPGKIPSNGDDIANDLRFMDSDIPTTINYISNHNF
jgi:hypothetical protein